MPPAPRRAPATRPTTWPGFVSCSTGQETSDPGEFLESLRFEINASEVYVFTPKGQLVGLPGVHPIDFAYAVHTEVGHHCIGARVNGRLVPLESTLDNGDLVEVLTSRADTAGPSRDWLHFVKSARARHKIKQWFTRERREEMVEDGREALAKAMRKKVCPSNAWPRSSLSPASPRSCT